MNIKVLLALLIMTMTMATTTIITTISAFVIIVPSSTSTFVRSEFPSSSSATIFISSLPSSSSSSSSISSTKHIHTSKYKYKYKPKPIYSQIFQTFDIDIDVDIDVNNTNTIVNTTVNASTSNDNNDDGNTYIQFAKTYPFANNFIIASLKTTAADVLAQTVIAQTPIQDIDIQRSLVFCIFGGLYSGAFQYVYQVQLFSKIFPDIDAFTQKSIKDKIQDIPGLQALVGQTTLDLTILTVVYLPTFYTFKAIVFTHSNNFDPHLWFDTGIHSYLENFQTDEPMLMKVWLPADLLCFSVPLYLRMPVRQVVSFLWTAYLSFSRGGH